VIRIIDQEGEKSLQAEQPLDWLKPEGLSLDYSIFTFRYLQVEKEWVEVIINDETDDKKWLKRKAGLEVVRWEDFLVEYTTAIEPLFPAAIKAALGEQAATLRKSSKEDCFEAVEVRGQWLRIRTNTVLECSEHDEPVADGWIRWRDDQRLLIEYFLTC
jgi:hypothetical protein